MLSQLGVARYDQMKMGHVGSPHCTLAHIFVFFFCVSRDWYLPCAKHRGGILCLPKGPVLELVPFRNLFLTLWKKTSRVCGVKYLRCYLGLCSCWSLYFGYLEDCTSCCCRWSTALRKLWNTRTALSYCLFLFSVTLWPYFPIYLLWFVRIKSLEACFWRCCVF